MITTVIVLYAAKKSKTVQFQDFDKNVLLKVSTLTPLSYLYLFLYLMYFVIYKSFCLLCPDFPPPFAVCWEPCYRPGKHQKTQVFTSSFVSHLVLKFS